MVEMKMKEPEEGQAKPVQMQEKSSSYDEFSKKKEVKQFIDNWKKKGYTRRGVQDLLLILWYRENTDKGILKAAGDLLSKLKGDDALESVLSLFKIKSEPRLL